MSDNPYDIQPEELAHWQHATRPMWNTAVPLTRDELTEALRLAGADDPATQTDGGAIKSSVLFAKLRIVIDGRASSVPDATKHDLGRTPAQVGADGGWPPVADARKFLREAVAEMTCECAPEHVETLADLEAELARVKPLRSLAQWLVALDEPDSTERRTVTMTQIIEHAREALEGPDAD